MKCVALLMAMTLANVDAAVTHGLRARASPAVPVRIAPAPMLPVAALASDAEHRPVVVVQAPAVPVAAVSADANRAMAESTASSESAVILEVQMRLQASNLMKYLTNRTEVRAYPAYQFWGPRCIEHTKRVVRRNDLSYTDVQLRSILIEQCDIDQRFPTTREDGFAHSKACTDFADDLVVARELELEGKGTEGYDLFCHKYYEHMVGKPKTTPAPVKVEEAPKPEPAAERSAFERFGSWLWSMGAWIYAFCATYIAYIVVLLIVGLLAGLLLRRRSASQESSGV